MKIIIKYYNNCFVKEDVPNIYALILVPLSLDRTAPLQCPRPMGPHSASSACGVAMTRENGKEKMIHMLPSKIYKRYRKCAILYISQFSRKYVYVFI